MQLPAELQKELVEKAAAKYGNCQELAKHLNIPKSSVHYYRTGRLTMPVSVMERMLEIAGDQDLAERIASRGVTKDRTWANEYAVSIYREMQREKLRLPTTAELRQNDELRRKAAAIVSYVLAEGSIWVKRFGWDEAIVNITFADHEEDLYNHFRSLCNDVFAYDIGPPQAPGNGARAIRGFLYSTFIAQWLESNGVPIGDKSAACVHLPKWVMESLDVATIVSALQPWCDGEGCVARGDKSPSFVLSQSRHTELTTRDVPRTLASNGRSISKGSLAKIPLNGMSVLDHCRIRHRSEVFDDVFALFARLRFLAKIDVSHLHLKQDGLWSCEWRITLGSSDTLRMMDLGIVTQNRKRAWIADSMGPRHSLRGPSGCWPR